MCTTALDRRAIDSLHALIQTQPVDTVLANAYLLLGEKYASSELDSMIYYTRKSLAITTDKIKAAPHEEMNLYKLLRASSLNNIGYAYKKKGAIQKALGYYQQSLAIKEELGLEKNIPVTLVNIGSILHDQGNIPKAIDYYSKAMQLCEKVGNNQILPYALNNLARVYEQQEEYDKAFEYYNRRMEIDKALGNKTGIATVYNNIGVLNQTLNKLDDAIDCFEKSLAIRQEIGAKRGIATSFHNLGVVYDMLGENEKAFEYLNKSLAIRKEAGYTKGIAVCLRSLGYLYLETNDVVLAIENGNQTLRLSEGMGFLEGMKEGSKLMWLAYKKLGAYSLAMDHYRKYITLRDSIYNEKTQKAALKQQLQYEYDKEELSIRMEEEKERALAAKEKEKKTLIIYVATGGMGLVLVFALLLSSRLLVIRRQRNTIEKQKEVVALQNKDIVDSINYAERIQHSILPSDELLKNTFSNSFVMYKPKDIVSGDFYWVQEKNETVFFSVADCLGSGVPGAFMSIVGTSLLSDALANTELQNPAEILNKVQKEYVQALELSEENALSSGDMRVALCAWNKNGTLQYSAANMPMLLVREGEIVTTKVDKNGIGFSGDVEVVFENHTLSLQKGDTVYLYSDGYQDQFGGGKGKKFKAAEFKKLLLNNYKEPMEKQKQILLETIRKWRGSTEQMDDILVMGIQF